jgi:hypothetical protein
LSRLPESAVAERRSSSFWKIKTDSVRGFIEDDRHRKPQTHQYKRHLANRTPVISGPLYEPVQTQSHLPAGTRPGTQRPTAGSDQSVVGRGLQAGFFLCRLFSDAIQREMAGYCERIGFSVFCQVPAGGAFLQLALIG